MRNIIIYLFLFAIAVAITLLSVTSISSFHPYDEFMPTPIPSSSISSSSLHFNNTYTFAVLFKVHQWNHWIKFNARKVSKVWKIRQYKHDFYIVVDVTNGGLTITDIDAPVWTFNNSQILPIIPNFEGAWLNQDPVVSLFSRDHPQYTHIWSVEYDAVYTGAWDDLLSEMENEMPRDLMVLGDMKKSSPAWEWYPKVFNDKYPEATRWQSFLPLVLFSAKFLAQLTREYTENGMFIRNWEASVPSLCQVVGCNWLQYPHPCYAITNLEIRNNVRKLPVPFQVAVDYQAECFYHAIKPLGDPNPRDANFTGVWKCLSVEECEIPP